jgi:hypothetical protein
MAVRQDNAFMRDRAPAERAFRALRTLHPHLLTCAL